MRRFICLHVNGRSNEIWIDTDAIIAVTDMRPRHNWTLIDTYSGTEGYCVDETAESVMRLIEQKTNPLDNYVCPAPVSAKWIKARFEEEEE